MGGGEQTQGHVHLPVSVVTQVLRAAQRSAGPGAVRDNAGRVVKGGCRIVVGIG